VFRGGFEGFGGGWESRFGDGGTVGGGDGGGVQRSGVDGLGSCALEPVERDRFLSRGGWRDHWSRCKVAGWVLRSQLKGRFLLRAGWRVGQTPGAVEESVPD
jgi:hypothetical protein